MVISRRVPGPRLSRERNRQIGVSVQVSSIYPFVPTALPGCQLWLDAADTATITSSGSPAKVSQWNDKSRNAYNVTQATAGLQPTTAAVTQNGLNTLSWGGTSAMRTANGALNSPVITCWMIAKVTTANRAMFQVPQSATVHTSPFSRWNLYVGASLEYSIRINGSLYVGGTMSTTKYASYRLDTSEGDAYGDSVLKTNGTGASLTYPASLPFIIGANATNGENFNGQVCEIVVFNRQMSAGEIVTLETYFKNKWAL